jgi:hypothetical protein
MGRERQFSRRAFEGGSVVVWILVAIILFAALSLAVTRGMRGGGEGKIAQDMARARAVDVLQYGASLRGALQALKVEGVSADRISFESPLLSGYANAACTDESCRVFGAGGGGIGYRAPQGDWLDPRETARPLYGQWYFAADVCVDGAGSGDATCAGDGLDNEDIVAFLPWIRKEVCIGINEKLGVDNPGGNPPVETASAWGVAVPKFTGGFSDGTVLNQPGLSAGCFVGSGVNSPPAGTYAFFQVLSAR